MDKIVTMDKETFTLLKNKNSLKYKQSTKKSSMNYIKSLDFNESQVRKSVFSIKPIRQISKMTKINENSYKKEEILKANYNKSCLIIENATITRPINEIIKKNRDLTRKILKSLESNKYLIQNSPLKNIYLNQYNENKSNSNEKTKPSFIKKSIKVTSKNKKYVSFFDKYRESTKIKENIIKYKKRINSSVDVEFSILSDKEEEKEKIEHIKHNGNNSKYDFSKRLVYGKDLTTISNDIIESIKFKNMKNYIDIKNINKRNNRIYRYNSIDYNSLTFNNYE